MMELWRSEEMQLIQVRTTMLSRVEPPAILRLAADRPALCSSSFPRMLLMKPSRSLET
jgi:hypothetical protein